MSTTIPTPATTQLAKAVRDSAFALANGEENPNASELLNCFARLLEGKDLDKAMGAPGDWGYGTPIGDAVHALLKEECQPPRLAIPTA